MEDEYKKIIIKEIVRKARLCLKHATSQVEFVELLKENNLDWSGSTIIKMEYIVFKTLCYSCEKIGLNIDKLQRLPFDHDTSPERDLREIRELRKKETSVERNTRIYDFIQNQGARVISSNQDSLPKIDIESDRNLFRAFLPHDIENNKKHDEIINEYESNRVRSISDSDRLDIYYQIDI